jgi:DNA-binding transcriptional LysR family regulator
MFDRVTLDQLRMLLAVVESGSFSAAARKVGRVQSAVSHAMTNLEAQLGLRIWDRSSRTPTLTAEGKRIVEAARRVCREADAFRRESESFEQGLEPVVSLCIDALFPVCPVVSLCRDFMRRFPAVELRVQTELMSAVVARIQDGTCHLAIAIEHMIPQELEKSFLASVRLVTVVARDHALAAHPRNVSRETLRAEVQIVLSERGGTSFPDQGVLSPRTFRTVDMSTKQAMLIGGLGWGNMPEHIVRDALRAGSLIQLYPQAWNEGPGAIQMSLVHKTSLAMGPAMRWLAARIAELAREELAEGEPLSGEHAAPDASSEEAIRDPATA